MTAIRRSADGHYLLPPDGEGPLIAPRAELEREGLVTASAGGRDAVRALRNRNGNALLAAPPAEGEPWDDSDADALLFDLPADPEQAARTALRTALRAGGRPVLGLVREPDTDPDGIVAAVDVGAAGALVDTGNPATDRRLSGAALELEAERLDDAPLLSAIVCNHNGEHFLDRCLAALGRLTYPRYEVIVVDDGSTDRSREIARRHGVKLVELDKVGLSAARNAGVAAADGEAVAFIDNDTEAEPHWLDRTWRLLDRLGADATGGPNLPFPDAGFEERVVSGAPGANTPVVNEDGTAVLLAGCNMAFRRDALLRAGGFDESFPGAYDDVVFCLRMADAGGKLVYHPTASIWHHRRDSIGGFIQQQYKWGLGTNRYEGRHEGRRHAGGELTPSRSLKELTRLDRGRLRYVFSGPQADQLYLLTSQPLHLGLPLKLLTALGAAWLAGAPLALVAGRFRAWVALGVLAKLGLFAVVASRVPVVAPEPGPRGLAQRLATAVLWFAQPLAWRVGSLRARRGAKS